MFFSSETNDERVKRNNTTTHITRPVMTSVTATLLSSEHDANQALLKCIKKNYQFTSAAVIT